MKSTEKRVLTPEQIALSEERKRRKAEAVAKAAAAGPSLQQSPRKTLPRDWLTLEDAILSKYSTNQAATVMSWNVSTVTNKKYFRRLYNNIQSRC